MKVHRIVLAFSAVTLSLSASLAFAQFQNAEKAIEYRQRVMTIINTNFGRIGAVV